MGHPAIENNSPFAFEALYLVDEEFVSARHCSPSWAIIAHSVRTPLLSRDHEVLIKEILFEPHSNEIHRIRGDQFRAN